MLTEEVDDYIFEPQRQSLKSIFFVRVFTNLRPVYPKSIITLAELSHISGYC